MSSENTKIWQFNQYQKPDNTPSNIDADLESLIRKVDRCKNDPEKSSIKKKSGTFNVYDMDISW